MEFPKQIKDTVYRLLQEPTLDHFREFLQDQKLMFLQHQMRSRTVLSNWKANTQQLSQR